MTLLDRTPSLTEEVLSGKLTPEQKALPSAVEILRLLAVRTPPPWGLIRAITEGVAALVARRKSEGAGCVPASPAAGDELNFEREVRVAFHPGSPLTGFYETVTEGVPDNTRFASSLHVSLFVEVVYQGKSARTGPHVLIASVDVRALGSGEGS